MIYYRGMPIDELSKEEKIEYKKDLLKFPEYDYLGEPNLTTPIKKPLITPGRIALLSCIVITLALTQNIAYCFYLTAGYTAYRFNK